MKEKQGHFAALFTIFVWGTTFIATKLLLGYFAPVEILFIRFFMGYIALWLAYPKVFSIDRSREKYFIFAGICGVTLYFLLENIALTYTLASNVGVIVAISPCFTALFSWLLHQDDKPNKLFFIGFLFAILCVYLISTNGQSILEIHPTGDLLALLAAMVWALYSICTKKISEFGYGTIPMTRRIFFYGLLFMIPALFLFGFDVSMSDFMHIEVIFNLIFLGLGASAICFVSWNFALKKLGSIKCSTYIYLVPVITVVTSMIVLKEKVTIMTWIGMILTLAGLMLSQRKKGIEDGKHEMCYGD